MDFFFRSEAWREQRKVTLREEPRDVDETSQVDISLVVFWEVLYD